MLHYTAALALRLLQRLTPGVWARTAHVQHHLAMVHRPQQTLITDVVVCRLEHRFIRNYRHHRLYQGGLYKHR